MNFKKYKHFLFFVYLNIPFALICAQYNANLAPLNESKKFQWPEGKKLAISLTFDDARLSQIDKGIPLLDKYNVKATFYVSPDGVIKRVDGWKKAIDHGHEIGNHSYHHPCTGNFGWSSKYALEDYSMQSMSLELDSANRFIKDQLGVNSNSFAYLCGQTFIGRGKEAKSYIPLVSAMFESGRVWLSEGPNNPSCCDMAQLMAISIDGKSFEEIEKIIDNSTGQWLIFAGHEIDEAGGQSILLSTIEELCKFASEPENGIWIANVHTIAQYIAAKRN